MKPSKNDKKPLNSVNLAKAITARFRDSVIGKSWRNSKEVNNELNLSWPTKTTN